MILIFVNPFSGSGRNRQRVDALVAALRDHHRLEAVVVDSLEERRKQLADPNLADRCSCLVVAGGDGTIASVINETHLNARPNIPLAIIPVGNENLLARELNLLKATPLKLAAAIAKGKTMRIDIGVAQGNTPNSEPRIFTLMASAGLDSDVVCRVEAWRKLPQGLRRATRLSYLKPMLAGVLGYHFKPLKLIVDNNAGSPIHGYHAFIFNINRYGGGLGFCPDACCDDGKLDYIILTKPGRLHALRYLALVALGWHIKCKDLTVGCAKTLRIESDEPLPVQADGDTIGHTSMDFQVIPNAVKLVVAGK